MQRIPACGRDYRSGLARESGPGPRKSFAAKAAPTVAAAGPRKRSFSTPQQGAQQGFTLVELVMVIALAGVIAVLISTVMSNPLQSFVDQSRRAELVDKASMALNRMARDVRLAVPNSLTAIGSSEIRMLSIAAAGRYRANQPVTGGPRVDPPQCPQAGNCSIDILSPITPGSSTAEHWLIIYSTNASELGAVASPSVISPKAFSWSGGALSADLQNFRFKYASPQHRFYLVKDLVNYRCDGAGIDANENGTGKLWRGISENLNGSNPSESLVVDSVSGCSFTYAPGTNTRNGLLTLRLTLAQEGETITLLQQVHVDNAP